MVIPMLITIPIVAAYLTLLGTTIRSAFAHIKGASGNDTD
jgi:Flp pilus assembly pilin Flp